MSLSGITLFIHCGKTKLCIQFHLIRRWETTQLNLWTIHALQIVLEVKRIEGEKVEIEWIWHRILFIIFSLTFALDVFGSPTQKKKKNALSQAFLFIFYLFHTEIIIKNGFKGRVFSKYSINLPSSDCK